MSIAQLAQTPVTQRDVEIAWSTYRALILAEVNDAKLLNDPAHNEAVKTAFRRYTRLYADWCRS